MVEEDYWLGFSVFPGVGPVTFTTLLHEFGSAKNAWSAQEKELRNILKEKKTKDFLLFREKFDFADYEKKLEKAQVTVVTWEDPLYPEELKEIKNSPYVLYAKGNLSVIASKAKHSQDLPVGKTGIATPVRARDDKIVAIVGTRKITQYGRQVTEMFTKDLVTAGCVIVSGLAMGVDAVAHQTTIDTGGKTIAVLGCGVDCCYPRENKKVYDAILSSEGLILSEIPLGQSAGVGTFPARNRIVAGISDGIVVTEGAEDSGALITAEFGLEFGKKVFAIPGPITSTLSKGPYKLIEKGATLVTEPKQILAELGIDEKSTKSTTHSTGSGRAGTKILPAGQAGIKGDTKEEQVIIDLLEKESVSFDELVRLMKIDPAQLASIISLLELKGVIISSGNDIFSLAT